MITLNQRLTTVCNYLVPGNLAALVQTMPIFLSMIQHGLITHAIAGEVIKGPFEAAKNVS